jgi:hypothetical protein
VPIRDEDGHRVMLAAGKAWKAIKTSGAKTWREWTEVIGPGLVKARAEAQSISNASSGKGYNTAMGRLLEEYGFGNALERHRSQVTRADLLHCMDYLTEIEKWRHDAKASVLLPVERHRKHRYPDHTVLNHPSVVWRQFKTSEDGKQALKDRGIAPTKPRAPKPTTDLKRDLDQANARNEELKEELEAARFLGRVTEAAAAQLTEADAQAYQQERSRLVRALIEADLGITRAEIERIRRAYVALLPVDPEARRAELEALKRELHLEPGTKRRRTKMADPLSLHEHIAKQSAEAAKNKEPMEPLAPSWSPRPPQSEAKLESATAQSTALVWERDGIYHQAKAGLGRYLVGPIETLDGHPFDVMHFQTGKVIAEERRDLGTAKSLKAAKAMAASDWAQRSAISTDPLPATKPTALEWKSVTPYLEPSFPSQSARRSNDRHHGANPLGHHVWAVPQRVRVCRSG